MMMGAGPVILKFTLQFFPRKLPTSIVSDTLFDILFIFLP